MAIRKTFQLGKIDEPSRSVPVIASTSNPVVGPDGVESLIGWSLDRFEANPIVLWMHDMTKPIGSAKDIVPLPDGGLAMTLVFARNNAQAEEIWQLVRQEVLRTVSVGFEAGAATEVERDGQKVTEYRKNNLLEVSVVSVPADEDAGTAALSAARATEPTGGTGATGGDAPADGSGPIDDADVLRKKAASDAARALANHRHQKLDASDVLHLDHGSLGSVERTQVGGARIKARLCRVGVLEYRNADGSTRRELRLPEEVFHPDSLATLKGAPVIDIEHHTGMVTPASWRQVSLGRAENVHVDGDYVSAELVVQDEETLERIDRGERTEISCGYVCRNETSPGVWKGQRYDVVQRDIRYNHAALCPPNRGRAGPTVGLRFDADGTGGATTWCLIEKEEEASMKTIRLDGKDYEIGSQAHLDKVDEMHKVELAAKATAHAAELSAANAAHTKAKDELQGRFDAKEAAAKKSDEEMTEYKKKAAEKEAEDKKKSRSLMRSALRLAQRVLRMGGKDEDADEDKDGDKAEEKMDALIDACSDDPGKVMLEAIQKKSPEFKGEGKSLDYITARFDAMAEDTAKRTSPGDIVHAVEDAKARLDAADRSGSGGSVDKIVDAAEKAEKANNDAWKTPASVVKGGK